MTTRLNGSLIIPKRIQQARLARGMTVSQLSDLVGVSRQMISRYESGANEPSSEVCMRLAQELEVPVGYFSKPIAESDSTRAIYYRKAAATTVRLQNMVEERANWLVEIIRYLERYIDLPERDLPDFSSVERPISGWNFDVIDELAMETRKAWGLGSGPISNLVALLENHGVLIARMTSEGNHMDACSWITKKHAFMLLESSKTAVRERFDLAHELGHLVLHPGIEPTEIMDKEIHKQIEDEAHRFASAFLMPKRTFKGEIAVPTLQQLVLLKSRWKVSIQAMVRRMYDINLIDQFTYQKLYKQMNGKRWTRFEPLDDQIQREEPSLLRESVELLVDNGIKTPDSVVNDIQLPQDEIESLCVLPRGYLNPRRVQISIKRVK